MPFNELKIKAEFSLNEARTAAATHTTNVAETRETNAFSNEPFTEEALQQSVVNYAKLKEEGGNKQLFISLTFKPATLKEGNIAVLHILNEVQRDKLNEARQELLDHLRQELKNSTIALEIMVAEEEAQTKAYKPVDKFRIMAEKNAALLELKKRFDLDIEY